MIDAVSGSSARPVAAWLLAVAAGVAGMILLGGLVRVTGSGLSIVEWEPVVGIMPPLSARDWERAFAAYRESPEFAAVNSWMTLDDFRTIFWWEWAHRFLGRLLGAAYLLPLLWFAWRRQLRREWAGRLLLLLVLGASQGVIGWLMVRSGLSGHPQVSPYLLALHLGMAFLLLGLLLDLAWTLLRDRPVAASRARRPVIADVLLVLLFAQILAGALVAGTQGGLVFNDWPLMGGAVFPERTLALDPAWRALFEDPGLAQFAHRLLAYLVLALALILVVQVGSTGTVALGAIVIVQVLLGIATLVLMAPPVLAIAHQAGAVATFSVTVLVRRGLRAGG